MLEPQETAPPSADGKQPQSAYRPGTLAKLLIYLTPLAFLAVMAGLAPMVACVVPLILSFFVAISGLKHADPSQRETCGYIALGFGVVAGVMLAIFAFFKLLPIVWKLLK